MTPERRIKDLQQLTVDFSAYLKTTPGTILSPSIRLGIAICARDALLKCKGCHDALEQELCLRPGSSFYAFCEDMEHEPAFPIPPTASLKRDTKVETCLVNIVHSVICHQNRLDEIWYKDALAAIQSCGILDDYANELNCKGDEHEMELASYAVFSEIVTLAAVSHGLHSTLLILGDMLDGDVPVLPSWDEMKGAPGPSYIRFSSLLHRIRKGPFDSHLPCFYRSDINKQSPEYAKIETEVWREISNLPIPGICANFSPRDNVMFFKVHCSMYLTPRENFNGLVWT